MCINALDCTARRALKAYWFNFLSQTHTHIYIYLKHTYIFMCVCGGMYVYNKIDTKPNKQSLPFFSHHALNWCCVPGLSLSILSLPLPLFLSSSPSLLLSLSLPLYKSSLVISFFLCYMFLLALLFISLFAMGKLYGWFIYSGRAPLSFTCFYFFSFPFAFIFSFSYSNISRIFAWYIPTAMWIIL